MSDPTIKTISEWAWTKVATSVITGVIHRLNTLVYYYQTYRLTGTSAPSAPVQGVIPEEAVRIFDLSNQEPIGSTFAIDIYIMCANKDDDSSDSGKIRVDV